MNATATRERRHITTLTADEIAHLGALTDIPTVCAVLGVEAQYARALCSTGRVKAVKVGKSWRVCTDSLLSLAGLK